MTHIPLGTPVVWVRRGIIGRVVEVNTNRHLAMVLWDSVRGFPTDPWNLGRLVLDTKGKLAWLIAEDIR